VSRILRARSTRAVVGVGAALGALALAGCGAGQISQTSNQESGSDGVNAGISTPVVVRNAVIAYGGTATDGTVYPVGGSAPLQMYIVNQGNEIDRLVSASSPAAASVQVSGETEVPGGQVLIVEGAPQAETGPATSTSTAQRPRRMTPLPPPPPPPPPPPATATPTATPRPTSTPGAIGMPGTDRVAQVTLVGLREDIRAGLTYPIVLVFERAGELRFDVPVGDPTEPREAAAE
jgi:copper(I)-binding protein